MGQVKKYALIFALATFVITPTSVLAEPIQSSSQQARSRAIATGENSTAITHIHQSSHQRQLGEDKQGRQISNQRAEANATATGRNTTSFSNISQLNHQSQLRDGSWANPQVQISNQGATANTSVRGSSSNGFNNLRQENSQGQF